MASITSLSGSSSTSSIYSNANAITGLASGLDTEALIEQAVSAYETKIASLQQDQTMVEWQQEAYREIIAKVVAFSEKYTSYSSDTNLFSNAFFENAVNAIASGTYANLVSVSGTTDSSISILGVKQLATNASYSVNSSLLNSGTSASSAVALSDSTKKSNITGTMTLKSEAGDTVTLTFDASDIVTSEEELAKLIQSKLEENADFSAWASKVSYSENGGIDFGDLSISAATGDLEKVLAKDDEDDFTGELVADAKLYESDATVAEAIDGQTLTFTYNGTAKSIKLSALDEEGNALSEEAFLDDLNTKLADAFGSGVTADYVDGKLTFSAADNESLSVSGTALTTLGFSDTNQASYVDTSDTLRDLLGDDLSDYKNENGLYDFTINGVKIGSYTADTSLSTIMADINSNEEAGVKVSFSKLSNSFQFTATESGSAGKVEISGGLAGALFGDISKTGQDAILTVEANGKEVTLTRSSNTVDLDGMEVTLKGTFGYETVTDGEGNTVTQLSSNAKANAVTFESKVDATELTSTLKEMVNDYNEMVKLIKEAYKTNPLKNSSGERYEPLTDDDKSDMSESAIKAYEEKAKTGILFGDSDLSSMYYQLTSAITNNVVALNKIGITTNYSDGLTTLSLDEDALEKALEKDPNSVAEAFVGTDGNSGFMGAVDSVLDTYAKTTGATKGILLQKAGSSLAPTTVNDNTLQDKINDYEELIEKWQDKLADKVDYYTRQFTLLEQLMAEMNSQSSTISGLMGY